MKKNLPFLEIRENCIPVNTVIRGLRNGYIQATFLLYRSAASEFLKEDIAQILNFPSPVGDPR
jgi:hypothetical protein